MSDGTKFTPDGIKIAPDGTRYMPDGTQIIPDGTQIMGGMMPNMMHGAMPNMQMMGGPMMGAHMHVGAWQRWPDPHHFCDRYALLLYVCVCIHQGIDGNMRTSCTHL